ncbi:MAG: hypothetical protein ACK4N4_03245 [Burkholderiales bacterium]
MARHRQETALQFDSSTSCEHWVESLPLTNVRHAQQLLAAQLRALTATPLPPLERLAILETLQEAAAFVQEAAARRYAGKPLPLDAGDAAAWDDRVALWHEMGRNYELCLRAYREGDLAMAPHAALACGGGMRCLGHAMAAHYRVYREVPAALWRALHELYSFAEQHGFARTRLGDGFTRHGTKRRDADDSSCAESYLRAVLLHLANPYALSGRQLDFVQRWLEKWAALAGLAAQPLPPSPIPALAVDLGGSNGVVTARRLPPEAQPRYLDLEQLAKTLRQMINLLKQGQAPAELGLGHDARQPGCENLLMLLYVQWCRGGVVPDKESRGEAAPASICFGIPAVHFHLSGGRIFRPPGELTAREKQELDTFGYLARVEHEAESDGENALDTCEVLDHSAAGFMCIRRAAESRVRIAHHQLLAVRRAGGRHFHLGMVQWLKTAENGELRCGIRLFPGTPQAVAVRPSASHPANGSYGRALLLPEVSAPATPATLILPAGWFQSGHIVEILAGHKQVVKLLNLLEKGSDFDRGTIAIV